MKSIKQIMYDSLCFRQLHTSCIRSNSAALTSLKNSSIKATSAVNVAFLSIISFPHTVKINIWDIYVRISSMYSSTMNLERIRTPYNGIYSITSMARIRMARLPWMIRTFFQSLQNPSSTCSSRKQIFRDFFLILSWNCMLCVLIRIASSRRF